MDRICELKELLKNVVPVNENTTPDVLWTTHTVSNDHCDLAGDTGREYICFLCSMVPGLTSGDTHVDLKVIDGTL